MLVWLFGCLLVDVNVIHLLAHTTTLLLGNDATGIYNEQV